MLPHHPPTRLHPPSSHADCKPPSPPSPCLGPGPRPSPRPRPKTKNTKTPKHHFAFRACPKTGVGCKRKSHLHRPASAAGPTGKLPVTHPPSPPNSATHLYMGNLLPLFWPSTHIQIVNSFVFTKLALIAGNDTISHLLVVNHRTLQTPFITSSPCTIRVLSVVSTVAIAASHKSSILGPHFTPGSTS